MRKRLTGLTSQRPTPLSLDVTDGGMSSGWRSSLNVGMRSPRLRQRAAVFFMTSGYRRLMILDMDFLISCQGGLGFRGSGCELLQQRGGVLESRHEDHGGDDKGFVAGLLVGGDAALLEDVLGDLALGATDTRNVRRQAMHV